MLVEIGWVFGYVLLPVLAYILRDFRYLQLSLVLPQLLLLVWMWRIPESPRWLLSNAHFTKAESAITKATEINKPTSIAYEVKQKFLLIKEYFTKEAESNK